MHFGIGDRAGLFLGHDAVLDRLLENAFLVEAFAVIDDLDVDRAALVIGAEDELAGAGLSVGFTFLGQFDTVVELKAEEIKEVAEYFSRQKPSLQTLPKIEKVLTAAK